MDERKCQHGYGIKQGPCPTCDAPVTGGMDVDEATRINEAIKVLEKHGYQEAAYALKAVCLREFQLIAESLH